MVTMPDTAAHDYRFVQKLVNAGMNSARINCASDGPETWLNMITNIRKANRRLKKSCRIMMDLSGPKLRTGNIVAGPEVVHVKPKKNLLGQVTEPAKLWLGKADRIPMLNDSFKILPIDTDDLKKLRTGDSLRFKDSRGKSCKIKVGARHKRGFWAYCSDSAYVTSGKIMQLKKKDKTKTRDVRIGSLQAVERNIILKTGDELILHKVATEGESSSFDDSGELLRQAHISCTLPSVLDDVKVGESVYFDDGKIGGKIIDVRDGEVLLRIVHAKEKGSKLRANKGINFPDSKINLKGLTEKDKEDLQFVCFQADVVSLSFVNDVNDVQDLLDTLEEYKSDIGLILKIETKRGLKNIASIILRAMQSYPIGILIARGDLAVEAGWKKIGFAQEDIRRICKAAHIPSIWATQVLESYAKKGIPSRAELTDAIRARKTECIMLNKGPYILKTIELLDKLVQGNKTVDGSIFRENPVTSSSEPTEEFVNDIKPAGFDDDRKKNTSESIAD